MNHIESNLPEILAPAGSKPAFLAALAAGTDAIYCGFKRYSARMAATNFSIDELAALTALAHDKGVRVYVTLNSLLRPQDLEDTARLMESLEQTVQPDALIFQDLAVANLARRIGFTGELHLSTLANAGVAKAMPLFSDTLGLHRVVVPRELSIDEIRLLDRACPDDLGLEVFIHGALCYAVSGRCYWSSYMGGKSGLRGRCVQPCRRRYAQGKNRHRAFSCQDLSLDVLVKVLKTVSKVRAWKIEGRKKGPHYVYYTVSAYRMLRDEGGDPNAKRAALELLAHALGRSGTHYRFLPQRPQHPVQKTRQTGSGLFIGRIRGGKSGAAVSPREALLAGDSLRIGYEDEPWHAMFRVSRAVPKKGRLSLHGKIKRRPPEGTAVFLTDRIEPALAKKIAYLEKMMGTAQVSKSSRVISNADLSSLSERVPRGEKGSLRIMDVFRQPRAGSSRNEVGLWLSGQTLGAVKAREGRRIVWWLPPVSWPQEEDILLEQIRKAIKMGAKRFVLNAPWQIALFQHPKSLDIWAGPFCNLANPLALETLAGIGFDGAILSPELGGLDYMDLPGKNPIPLGLVTSGNYPLCISRIGPESIDIGAPFSSPKGEEAWTVRYGENYWTYPNWEVDLQKQQKNLERVGYRLFVKLHEPIPKTVNLKKRPGGWNWDHNLR